VSPFFAPQEVARPVLKAVRVDIANADVVADLRILPLVLFVISSVARAGISAPSSSLAVSRDGSRILVMLSPYKPWHEGPAATLPDGRTLATLFDQAPTATLPDGRVVNVHDTFPKSGVYDASTFKPVWQVTWFSLQWDLLWSDDLRYVARLNRQGFRSDWAIAFYDQGKLTHSYNCSFLLPHMNSASCLPFETWDWHVRWCDNVDLDATHKTLLLATARRRTHIDEYTIDLGRQEFYEFDLATGSLLSSRSSGAWVIWKYPAALVTAVVLLWFTIRKLLRRIEASSRRRGFPIVATNCGAHLPAGAKKDFRDRSGERSNSS
jgi:hypothetical protein